MTKYGTIGAIITIIWVLRVIPPVGVRHLFLLGRLGGARVEPPIQFSVSSMPERLTVVRKVHNGSRILKRWPVLIRSPQFSASDVIGTTGIVMTGIAEVVIATT